MSKSVFHVRWLRKNVVHRRRHAHGQVHHKTFRQLFKVDQVVIANSELIDSSPVRMYGSQTKRFRYLGKHQSRFGSPIQRNKSRECLFSSTDPSIVSRKEADMSRGLLRNVRW